MKVFGVACFAFSAMIVLSNAEHSDEYQEAVGSCLKDMKISPEDFAKMIEEESEDIACIFACIHRKLKIFDGEKFDPKIVHEQIEKEMTRGNIEYTKKMRTNVDECIDEGNETKGDECEKNGAFMACLFADEDLVKKISAGEH